MQLPHPAIQQLGRTMQQKQKRQAKSPQASTQAVVKNLWHAQYSLKKYPTELWGLQATRPPKAQLLIVGGNPGLASFYCTFMQQLHQAFDGAADVLAVSHVGHDADNLSKGAVWCLDSQIQHKVHLLKELMAPGKPPTVILAHSIGSYIMLQALERLRLSRTQQGAVSSTSALSDISKVFLLMPFLATDWTSWEQRVLAAAARHHGHQLAAAVEGLQQGPRWLQDSVVHLMQPGAEPHAAQALRAALNPHGLRNNWHMAAHEFSALDGPMDWRPLQQLGSKAAVVYNPSDPWFSQYDNMREVLPGIEAYAHDGLGHAFCLSTDECRVVAQLVHQSVTAGAAVPAAAQDQAAKQQRVLREAAATS